MITDVMMECLLDWNIEHKISTLTVDNCSTNNLFVRSLVDRLSTGSLVFGGELFHVRCTAHILNLIVKDGLEIIDDSIERIRDSVSYWSSSPKREEKFLETVRQTNIESTKKLALDCKTRWNSTYLMIRTALVYRNVFPRLRQRDPQYKSLPSDDDWNLASELCDKLQVFYHATVTLSGTKYPTINSFLPLMCDIRFRLNEWSKSSNHYIQSMATQMIQKFDCYWSRFHGILAIGSILDPRYKFRVVDFYFPKLYDEKAVDEIERIRLILLRLVEEYQAKLTTLISQGNVPSFSNQVATPLVLEKSSHGWNTAFDEYISTAPVVNLPVKTELDYYLEEPIVPRNIEQFDVLKWWSSNSAKYPTLNCIVRDIFAIPVSTVASESAFSTGGRFVSAHRSRLHHKTIEALMCAQDWLWNELNSKFYLFHCVCVSSLFICDNLILLTIIF